MESQEVPHKGKKRVSPLENNTNNPDPDRAMRKDSYRKHQDLIRHATAMFLELGYEKASMNRLVSRSACSKSTLYKHFKSKEAMFIAVIDEALRDHLAPIENIDLVDIDMVEGLEKIADAGIEVITSPLHISLCRIIYAEAARIPLIGELYYNHGPRRGMQGLAAWLKQLVKAGHIQCRDPDKAAEFFWAMLLHKPMLERYCDLIPPMSKAERRIYSRKTVREFVDAFLIITRQ